MKNLFENSPERFPEEQFDTLLQSPSFLLERIVSDGQATPPGEWFDQERDEWVVLLQGSAGLTIEGEANVFELKPGDHLLIPAHRRHRVEWTDNHEKTVWLALHFKHDIRQDLRDKPDNPVKK